MTEHDLCASFRAALTALLAGSGGSEFPLEQARHLNDCGACQEWFDGQDPACEGDELDRRVMPLMEALATLDGERPPSPEQLALAAECDERERELEAAIRGFVDRHPELDPSAFGIDMSRFEPYALYSALEAMRLLIRHVIRRGESQPSSYGLRDDGAVFIGGAEKVPAGSVHAEIGRWVVHDRKFTPEEMTDDLAEALREEAAWSDDAVCAKFAAWVVQAVRRKPDLMLKFRMIGVDPADPKIILLVPIETAADERDAVALWNE